MRGYQTNVILGPTISLRQPQPYSDCVQGILSSSSSSYDESNNFTRVFRENKMWYRQKDCFNFCYATAYLLVQFGQGPCLSFAQTTCERTEYRNFFNQDVFGNCSRMCPLECVSVTYTLPCRTAA